MISKEINYRSLTVEVDSFVKAIQTLEKECAGQHSFLSVDVRLKGGVSYDLSNSGEVKQILKDELEVINGINVQFMCDTCKFRMSSGWSGIKLDIAASDRASLLVLEDSLVSLIAKKKNKNQYASANPLLPLLAYVGVAVLGISTSKLVPQRLMHFDVAAIIGAVVSTCALLLAWIAWHLLNTKYPRAVFSSAGNYSARLFEKDGIWVVVSVLLPTTLGFIVNLFS